VRLTPEEVAGIRAATAEVFGPDATVRLFGSRVDDAAKGGDIDLPVAAPSGRAALRDECALLFALEARLGERKIDVPPVEPGRPRAAIERIAFRDGVAP
jgi:predicted nucleotidyltransferase